MPNSMVYHVCADSSYSFDPQTSKYGVDAYPETKFVTALALRKDEPGVSLVKLYLSCS